MSGMASQHDGQALGGVNLLPGALCAVAILVYLGIFVNHVRHARETSGQRRLWHLGHVAMALGMAYMYLPAAAAPFAIADGHWQALYGIGLALVAVWLLWQVLSRGGASGLWLLLAGDLLAMLYMWSPGALEAPLSWLLVAYLVGEALLWMSGRIVGVDRDILPGHNILPGGGYSIVRTATYPGSDADGAVRVGVAAAAQTLACERDLRVSMSAMTLGMAYMVLAMLLMR